jgi:hypothetical protein
MYEEIAGFVFMKSRKLYATSGRNDFLLTQRVAKAAIVHILGISQEGQGR